MLPNMKTRSFLTICLITLLCLFSVGGWVKPVSAASSAVTPLAHIVTQISLAPATPNILALSQNITVNFSYSTTQAGGVQIFARPFTHGALSPGYGASGSPIYPTGSGVGSGSFTFASTDVTVDQIRFQMYNADQTALLFEALIPVQYQFNAGSYLLLFLPVIMN